MKEDLQELRSIVLDMLSEAKKGKKKTVSKKGSKGGDDVARPIYPKDHSYAPSLDFAHPQGDGNLLKMQGAASWGPDTGVAPDIENRFNNRTVPPEELKESFVSVSSDDVWGSLAEQVGGVPSEGVWESLERLKEGYMGFSKLKGKLARKKGVKDPGALAASIGRRKLGKAEFQRRAAAGHRK